MAIKGKSKKRGGGAKRASVAPKPIIVERKQAFLARKPVKRTILIVAVLAALTGGLRVWQNVGRSGDLKTYDRQLNRAMGLLSKNLDPNAVTGLTKNVSDFGAGKLTAAQFLALSKQWETDFNAAKADVAKLKGPKQLGDAQQLIIQGVDGYVGAARLYQVAAMQQQMADATAEKAKTVKDAAAKKILEDRAKAEKDQVQVILLHADEARQRGEGVLKLGGDKLDALKKAWDVPFPSPPAQDLPSGLNIPAQ